MTQPESEKMTVVMHMAGSATLKESINPQHACTAWLWYLVC